MRGSPAMNEDLAIRLHQRIGEALQRQHGDADSTSAQVPVERYVDPEVSEAELRLMRRTPQPVVHASALSTPGDWVSLTHMDTPLLLVRQPDHSVHAFLNVCRHRGARVVPMGSGSGNRAFVCPYHAWSYRTDGSLIGLPQAHGFPCLDKADSGLRRLACTERVGLIWVGLDPAVTADALKAQLGPLMDELESLSGLRSPVGFAPRSYVVEANWKLLVDGSFEAYHFKIAHRETIAHMFADNMQVIDEYGLNRRLYLVKSNFAKDKPSPHAFDARRYGNILYYFFPNSTLLVQPDHAQVSTLEPLGPTRTRVHEVTLIPEEPASDKALDHWQANVALYRRTLSEDYALSESIQAGLRSGANDALNFGTFEYSAPRFHAQLQQALADMAN